MELPYYRYHPDPIKTGSIAMSETICVCCGESRGYIYSGPVYAHDNYDDQICPWCIADGSAAEKYDATFSAGDSLAPLGKMLIDEVTRRTPGYTSWQQDNWQVHCSDACEFHGDISKEELRELNTGSRSWLCAELQLNEGGWSELVENYEPAGDPAIYKFICRHCAAVRYDWDCS